MDTCTPPPYQPPAAAVTPNAPVESSESHLPLIATSQLRALSIAQVLIGCLCIGFGIGLCILEEIKLSSDGGSNIGEIGYGIWIGLYYLTTGSVALKATKARTTCWLNSSMVLNIFSAIIFFPLLMTFVIVGIFLTDFNACSNEYYDFENMIFSICNHKITDAYYYLDILLLAMAIAEFIITTWSAAICCRAVCRCCKPTARRQSVQYTAVIGNQPQVVVYSGKPPTTAAYLQGQTVVLYPYSVPQQQQTGYVVHPQPPPAYYPQVQSAPADQVYNQQQTYQHPPPKAGTAAT